MRYTTSTKCYYTQMLYQTFYHDAVLIFSYLFRCFISPLYFLQIFYESSAISFISLIYSAKFRAATTEWLIRFFRRCRTVDIHGIVAINVIMTWVWYTETENESVVHPHLLMHLCVSRCGFTTISFADELFIRKISSDFLWFLITHSIMSSQPSRDELTSMRRRYTYLIC